MMKRSLSIIVAVLLVSSLSLLKAEDLLPSDVYYKNNIAVNEVSAGSPSLRGPSAFVPGGPGSGPGGPGTGEGTGGGGPVNSPIGDATLPLLVAGISYGAFILYRNKKKNAMQ